MDVNEQVARYLIAHVMDGLAASDVTNTVDLAIGANEEIRNNIKEEFDIRLVHDQLVRCAERLATEFGSPDSEFW